MKLIRHEAGHAYMYAYRLTRKKRWQEMFGQTSDEETPSFYRPRPFSRSYVTHLDDWYAQAHPDEDFAETFAIWLTPDFDWRKRYAGWKALQKLEYVDELMKSLAGKPPVHSPKFRVADYNFLNVKLKTYYARKRKLYEEQYPGFYDVDLDRQKMESFQPNVLFNLVEQFKNNPGFDQNIVSLLEMQGVPFTGCGSIGLTLCKHKGISKKILGHHGIGTPNFVVIPRGQRIGGPRQLKFPILVKPVKDEASYGISRASFVQNEEQFRERIAFIHEKHKSDAIAEEYID